MTYTENLNLALPEPSDPLDVTPLRANFAALDKLGAAQAEVEAAAAEIQSAVDAAVDELNAAVDAAVTRLQNATVYGPDNPFYVTGTYTPSSTVTNVTLGFKPSLVFITSGQVGMNSETFFNYSGFSCGGLLTSLIQITDTGFTAKSYAASSTYPRLSDSGRTYEYIAFK